MAENWKLIYDPQTCAVAQSGLKSVLGGFNTLDNTVHITLQGTLKIKRDRFSYSPVFYHIGAKWVAVAGHYLTMLSLLKKEGVKLEIDTDYVIDYLRYQCPWTYSTLCKQIRIVRNGEEITIAAGGFEIRRFDSLIIEQNTEPDMEYHLSKALRKLDIRRSVFHISSGLDSSLLVLLASKMSSPKEIRTVTCETLGHGTSDELINVQKLAKDIGFHLEVLDFKDINVFTVGKAFIKECLGYPIAHPSHIIEYLLDKSVSTSFNIIVSGRGPDECLAGYAWHQQDYSDKKKYLARKRVTLNSTIRNLLKENIYSPHDQFDHHLAKTYGNQLSIHDRLEIDQRMIAEAWGIVHSGMELGLGVSIVKPFENSILAERLFNMDETMMINGGIQKAYLRVNMAHYYPDYILNAPKRGFRLDLKPYLEKAGGFLDELLESEFTDRYLTKSELIKMHSNTINGGDNYGWQLWSLYLLANSSSLIFS